MKRNEAFPGKYLSKDDADPAFTATIAAVEHAMIDIQDGEPEKKTVMRFQGDVKPMILNTTNWTTLEDLYGDDSDLWIGKPVEIFKDASVMYGGKKIGGLRVRKPSEQQTDYRAAFVANPTTSTWAAFRASINAGEMEEKQAFGGLTVREWIKAEPGRTTAQAVEVLEMAMALMVF